MYATSVDLLTLSIIIFEVVIQLPLHRISVDNYKIKGIQTHAHTCAHSLSLSLSVTLSINDGYWIELRVT